VSRLHDKKEDKDPHCANAQSRVEIYGVVGSFTLRREKPFPQYGERV
jgi:hypothetical protein